MTDLFMGNGLADPNMMFYAIIIVFIISVAGGIAMWFINNY